MTDKNIHVAFATDRKYLEYAMVAIASLLNHAGSPVTVHLLHEELDEADFAKLRRLICSAGWELQPVRITDGELAGWPVLRWSHAIYYRLILPSPFPDLERIIYLDCDLIVQDDVAALWNTDLNGASAAAVSARVDPEHKRKLGMPEGAPYLNSGVLLLDLKKLRERHAEDAFKKIQKENINLLKYPDQDILNLFLINDLFLLHARWNLITSVYRNRPADSGLSEQDAKEALAAPAIIHYTGKHKPWNFWATTHHPYGFAFAKTAWKTPVSPWLKWKLRLKYLLGLYRIKPAKKNLPWDESILQKDLF